ncbi:MAG TPA: magnesium transporter CorA family protein, partial [bacterium]
MLKPMQIEGGRVVEGAEGPCPILIFVKPDERERKTLIEQHGIDEHTLNSALDPNELARVEFQADHTVLIIKRPKRYSPTDNFLFNVSSVGIFLFKERMVIVLSED